MEGFSGPCLKLPQSFGAGCRANATAADSSNTVKRASNAIEKCRCKNRSRVPRQEEECPDGTIGRLSCDLAYERHCSFPTVSFTFPLVFDFQHRLRPTKLSCRLPSQRPSR